MNASSVFVRRIAPARDVQRGFGLVELMISVAIGLVILAALVALFVNSSRNNREMATASSVIENGRFAIELLENDIVHAGYWGTYVPEFDDPTRDDGPPVWPPPPPAALPAPPALCEPYVAAAWVTGTNIVNSLISVPVQAFASDTAACADPDVLADAVPGTDVLVLRHAERCVPGIGGCEAEDLVNPDIFIQGSLCADELAGNPFVFGPTVGAAFGPPFTLTRRDCLTPAAKRRFVSYIYYVRNIEVADGDEIRVIPTLVRSEFRRDGATFRFQKPEPLIDGIDGLWVELGVDDVSITEDPVDNRAPIDWEDPDTKQRARNRGDGIPDGPFVRCDPECADLSQLINVTAVKVYVLARSREATRGYTDTKTYTVGRAGVIPAFGDGFKRHVYSTTVRLPNVSGRRIRPGVEPVGEGEEIILPGDPVDPVDPLPPVEPEVL